MWYNPNIIKHDYPIVKIEIYQRGIRVIRMHNINLCATHTKTPENTGRKDRPITMLSEKSLSRLAFTVTNTQVKFLSMMTLTYPKEWSSDGNKVKRELNAFLTWLRRSYKPISYLWFLEFQRRGAPHIHILISRKSPVTDPPRVHFAKYWATLIAGYSTQFLPVYRVHRHKTAWENIRSEYGAQGYVLKYALKPYQKIVPKDYQNVGRFWGCSRDVIPEAKMVIPANEEFVRALLKSFDHRTKDWDVIPHHIYELGREDNHATDNTPHNSNT